MRKADVEVGARYRAKVSEKVVTVRITGVSRLGGWTAVNEETSRDVRIKSAQRLRSVVQTAAEVSETKRAVARIARGQS